MSCDPNPGGPGEFSPLFAETSRASALPDSPSARLRDFRGHWSDQAASVRAAPTLDTSSAAADDRTALRIRKRVDPLRRTAAPLSRGLFAGVLGSHHRHPWPAELPAGALPAPQHNRSGPVAFSAPVTRKGRSTVPRKLAVFPAAAALAVFAAAPASAHQGHESCKGGAPGVAEQFPLPLPAPVLPSGPF